MDNIINQADSQRLHLEVLTLLGYPGRKIVIEEITEEVFIIHLGIVIQDYTAMINDWLLQQQWGNLNGLHIDKADLTFALTTKSLDFENSFAQAYGKQTGISTNGPWELKKDYITVSAHTQVYSIPANREVNEVLWYSSPAINFNNVSPLSPAAWIPGANGWNIGGGVGQSILPTYGYMLSMQDSKQKQKLLQSELTYRIIGGPDGTKQLFLYPLPGSADEMSGYIGKHYEGSKVFYFYYDTNSLGRKKCLEDNNDIVLTPNDININELTWGQLNLISKSRVRRLLIAKLKNYLALTRGYTAGDVGSINGKELKLDYSFLLDQAKAEEEAVKKEIFDSLLTFTYDVIMEKKASVAENLNRILKFTVPKTMFYFN